MPDAVIWGASGGIGCALVSLLKNQGWRVLAAARHEERIPPQADFVYHFDAERPDTVLQAARLMAQETDAAALMVYAAGGMTASAVDNLEPAEWAGTMAANLGGAYLMAHHALDLVGEGGHVMFLGAYTDRIMLPGFGAYAAAKAGLEALAGVLQKEHRRIKFTVVRPGAVDTPFWSGVPFKLPKAALGPEAVARAIFDHYVADRKGFLDL